MKLYWETIDAETYIIKSRTGGTLVLLCWNGRQWKVSASEIDFYDYIWDCDRFQVDEAKRQALELLTEAYMKSIEERCATMEELERI